MFATSQEEDAIGGAAVRKPGAGGLKTWSAAGLIVVAGLIAYATSFDGAFLFDDRTSIFFQPRVTEPATFLDALVGRRPVANLSLAFNYRVGGDDPWGYHAFNLTVHLLAGLVLFGAVRRTLGVLRWASVDATRFAWAVALLWVVHPLNTQAVTYIVQRAESLMGLFYLLTVYCAIRGMQGAGSSRAWYGLSVAACVLGMASKAVMITAPVMVVLYDWVFVGKRCGEILRRRWALYLGLAGSWAILWVIGLAGGVLGPLLDPSGPSNATVGFGYRGVSPVEYLVSQPGVILHYIRLALWPIGQCFDYGWPVARSPGSILGPGLVVITLLAATVVGLRKKHWLGFAGAWFFGILAPTSSFIPIKDLAFEHRMYLSLAAVVVVVVAGGRALVSDLGRRFGLSRRILRIVASVVVVCVAFGLVWATVERNRYYHSEMRIWQDVVDKRPNNPRGYVSLGVELTKANRIEEAEQQYRKAVELFPGEKGARANLGAVLNRQGKAEEALVVLEAAVRSQPKDPAAHHNLGRALESLGRNVEALEHFQRATKLQNDLCISYYDAARLLAAAGRNDAAVESFSAALACNPEDAESHSALGVLSIQTGRVEEAVSFLTESVRLNPESAIDFNNLGSALALAGRHEEAQTAFRRALDIDPGFGDARINLANLASGVEHVAAVDAAADAQYLMGNNMMTRGSLEAAAAHFRRAVEIDPTHARALNHLGVVLLEMGKFEQAQTSLERAVEIEPDFVEARRNLGNAYGRQGRTDLAVEQFESVAELRPDLERVRNDLGVLLMELGKLDEAREHLEAAMDLAPDSTTIRRNLARVHLRLGERYAENNRPELAVRELRKAARLAPDLPEVQQGLREGS